MLARACTDFVERDTGVCKANTRESRRRVGLALVWHIWCRHSECFSCSSAKTDTVPTSQRFFAEFAAAADRVSCLRLRRQFFRLLGFTTIPSIRKSNFSSHPFAHLVSSFAFSVAASLSALSSPLKCSLSCLQDSVCWRCSRFWAGSSLSQ